MHSIRPIPLLLLTLSIACSDAERQAGDVATWTLAAEPSLRIGAADGDERYLLHGIQDVAVLGDGSIAVANGGTQEIRIYGADGRYIRTAGGAGRGPGEFTALVSVDVMPADSLLALDSGVRRVSVFEPSGAPARSWTLESPGRGMYPGKVRSLDDGTVLVTFFRGRMPGDPAGIFRESAPIIRYSADGVVLNTVTQLSGEEWYYDEEQRILADLPFGRDSHFAVSGDRLYAGDGDELTAYSADGGVLSTMRPGEPRAVTPDLVREYTDRRLADMPQEAHSAFRRMSAGMPYPDSLPRYTGLLVDEGGRIWLEEYPLSPGNRSTWHVLDAAGRPLASVDLPPGFAPALASDSAVLGIMTDSLGVEYVAAYSVRSGRRE